MKGEMMATAVMRIETRNFATMKRKGETVLGIDEGGLIGLKKHNERVDINSNYELKSKSKKSDTIDSSKSEGNIYYKHLKNDEIEKLKSEKHRKNQVGAFEMVFDIQDLTPEQREIFRTQKAKGMKKIIDDFLQSSGIAERFETLEMVYHDDETNPHYHFLFSGWDKISQKWGYNDFFSPITHQEIKKDKNGDKVYKIHNRGKERGTVMRDEDGEPIPATTDVRKSRVQDLQDEWGEFLDKRTKSMSNKKAFASMLSFNNYVYSRFTKEEKAEITAIRGLEVEYYSLEDKSVKRKELRDEIISRISVITASALEIQSINNSDKRKKGNSKTLTKEVKPL